MSLRQSTILIIGLMFVALIGLSYLISRHVILSSFVQLEIDRAEQNAVRARNILKAEIDRIDAMVMDWAWWDDTAMFIEERDPEYIESNLVPETFAEQRLDLMVYITSSGEIIWGMMYDPDEERLEPLSPGVLDHVHPGSILAAHEFERSVTEGLLVLPNQTLLVSSRPVLDSEIQGPIRGTLIMGSALDQHLVEELNDRSQLQLSFMPLQPMTGMSFGPDIETAPTTLRVSLVMQDIYGKPALSISFPMSRDVYRQGLLVLRYHLFFLAAAAIAVSLLTLAQLNRRILDRVASLSAQVASIGRTGQPGQVELKGRDELSSLGRDINRMLQILQENESFLQQIKDNLEAGILIIDPRDHVIVDVNPYAARITGLQVNDIVGHVCHGFLCPFEVGKCPITDKGQTADVSTRYLLTSSGKKIPIYKSVSRIHRQGRELLLETFVDISEAERIREERRRLEEKLQQSQKMEAVGTLAGGIAHDFNNLLQIISGRVELLLKDKDETLERRNRLEEIDRAALRGRDLVRHLLTFSRKMEPEPQPMNLNDIVENSLQFMRRTVSRMIDLKFVPQEGLYQVMGDPTQMEQILLNLVSNACDAMPRGGTILVSTENATFHSEKFSRYLDLAPGKYVLLSVSDTGQGLEKEISDHIFEPFFTTKEIGKGTGLGLSTVYGIVKSHDGQISHYSEPGQGTTFKIYLPALEDASAAQHAAPQPVEIPLHGRETLLLVDDEEAIVAITEEMLTDYGYTVLSASSGEEALKIYSGQKRNIDLVILDLGMPGMGGAACMKNMLQRNPEARILIASGYGAHPMAANPGDYGAAAFVSKPYRIEVLLTEIRLVLDQGKSAP